MKKMYVSPEMNAEVFAANDYVAACWVLTCTSNSSHGSQVVIAPSQGEISDLWQGPLTDNWYYNGEINNISPRGRLEGLGHIVRVTPGADNGAANVTPNHPNASN